MAVGVQICPQFANQIRRRLPRAGDKWHLDGAVLMLSGMKHWLWRAEDQSGMVLDVLVPRPSQQASGQAAIAQFAEEADAAASGYDHRQAGQLWRGQTRGHAQH